MKFAPHDKIGFISMWSSSLYVIVRIVINDFPPHMTEILLETQFNQLL